MCAFKATLLLYIYKYYATIYILRKQKNTFIFSSGYKILQLDKTININSLINCRFLKNLQRILRL